MTNLASANTKTNTSICKCAFKQKSTPHHCCCISTNNVPIHHPDLAIYSQVEQLSLGAMPSWDSPDIVTNNWAPFKLRTEALVNVRNLSPNTPAANALVHYYTSPFGIGTQKTLKQSRMISLGAGQETTLNFPLDQQTLNGDQRIGVHIVIEHPNDEKQINNAGSQVHNGAYTSESGRNFTVSIPVFNDSPTPRQIMLSILPTDMIASLSMTNHTFLPYEQIIVNLHIEVPAAITGSPGNEKNSQVTVIGRLAGDNTLIGGITHLLRINN